TPGGLSQQAAEQVHDVRAQDHQVLTAAPTVLLAASPQLQQLADRSPRDQLLDPLIPRAVAGLERNGELRVRALAGRDDGVAIGESRSQRLLAEDMDAALRTGDDHLAMAVDPARGHRDELRLLAVEHRAI